MSNAIQGSLRSFKLADLLSLLSGTRKSGCLRLRSEGKEATLFFDNGAVIYAGSNQDQLRLGSLLLKNRKIDRTQLADIDKEITATAEKQGAIAVERGIITEEELRDYLKIQTSEVIYDSFVWADGSFVFDEAAQPPEYAVAISIDLANLMMEGARRIDEWSRCLELLPDPKMVFRVVANPDTEGKITLTRDEWRIVFLVNGRRTLEELCKQAVESSLAVYRVVYGLLANKLIESISPAEADTFDGSMTVRQNPATQIVEAPTMMRKSVEFEDDRNLLLSPGEKLSYHDVMKGIVARLKVEGTDGETGAYSLTEQEYRIGRLRENEIQLLDLAISGRHARVFRTEDGYVVEDLGSRNGTFINGVRIKEQLIRNGDALRVGATDLIYEVL